MNEYTQLLQQLLDQMAPVADFLRAQSQKFTSQDIEYKSRNDLVSYVDREAEARLAAACLEILPGSGLIMEESGEKDREQDWRWIIDPLDGTTNFIHHVPAWCMSVALQQQEKTVLGVVWDVPRGEVFSAVQGQGAWQNGTPISVSGAPRLRDSLLATGFPYAGFDRINDYMAVALQFLEESHGLRRFGAAALDLAWVACGRIEGFYEIGLQAWDVAAGALLVKEAGGKVTDFQGTDKYVFGRNIAASNGTIHTEMLNVICEKF